MRNLRKIFEHIAFYNRAPAREIAERALGIAADICVFTNNQLTIEELGKT